MFEKVKKFIRIKTSKVVCDAIMLHRVREQKSIIKSNAVYEITTQRLEEIITKYKSNGYKFISADTLAEIMSGKAKINGKFVCLTFDDGYRDNFELAYPILKKHNCPFIIFVNINNINGSTLHWRYALDELLESNDSITLSDGMTYICKSVPEKNKVFEQIDKKYCNLDAKSIKNLFAPYNINWDDLSKKLILTKEMIGEMAKDDICTIGSHAITHCHIAWLDEKEQVEELKKSKEILEEITGKEVEYFAYPFGNHSVTTIKIASKFYKSAFIARGGKVRKGENVFEMTRFILN